jgi:hypothetical protein
MLSAPSKYLCLLAVCFIPLCSLAQTAPSISAAKEDVEIPSDSKKKTVILQALNKITAKTSQLQVATSEVKSFGNLEIQLFNCEKAPPTEQPEVAALLRIWQKKPNEQRAQIFLGWMFASSPSLSALEHAVYDITVLDCID